MKKTIVFVSAILLVLTACDETSSGANDQLKKSEAKTIEVGDVLHTPYFDVTVNSFDISDELKTGNEFTDQSAENGNKFAVINVSFKNTDKESRMLLDGSLIVNHKGTEYKFDNAETILADGWGVMLDQINPMVSKTTNIAYKIPSDLTGIFYYNPDRSENDDLIYLGEIK